MLDGGEAFQFLFQKTISINEDWLAHLRNDFCPVRLPEQRPLGANGYSFRASQRLRNIGGKRDGAQF